MEKLRFSQLYRLPGEGIIVEFKSQDQTRLYNLDGLRYRVLQLRAEGIETSEEEKALTLLSGLSDP